MYHNTSRMNDIKTKIYEYYNNTKRDLDIATNIKNESVWSYLQMVGCIQDLKYQYDFSIEDIEKAFNEIITEHKNDSETENEKIKESILSIHVNPQITKDVFQHMNGFYHETSEDELTETETETEIEWGTETETGTPPKHNTSSESDSELQWKTIVHEYLKSILNCILSFIEKIKVMFTEKKRKKKD